MGHKRWTREEDACLRKLAGIHTAEEIGLILKRPKNGVHHRISKLGLYGHIHGEAHWKAKLSNLKAGMVGCLHDGGYTVTEIYRFLTEEVVISKQTVESICNQRTRRINKQRR